MVVKPPLQSQCQQLPIKDCGDLVDGVLLFVEGDKQAALRKINEVKNANEPAELKSFAEALRATAALPGADDFAEPMKEVADIIDSPTVATSAKPGAPTEKPGIAAVEPAAGVVRQGNTEIAAAVIPLDADRPLLVQQDPATRALSATADFARLFTDTVDLSLTQNRTPCKVAGLDGFCTKVKQGVIVITDVITSRGCVDRVFVGATLTDSPDFGFRWEIEAGSTPLTGARLTVGGGDWLQVAVVPGKKSLPIAPDCIVTWSGFRPWIVSTMGSGTRAEMKQ